jgi:hypothetical protein
VKQKILVAPRIQNDQRIELFWREIKINSNEDPFQTAPHIRLVVGQGLSAARKLPVLLVPGALPLATDNALSGL